MPRSKNVTEALANLRRAAASVVAEWNSPHDGRTERDEAVEPLVGALAGRLVIDEGEPSGSTSVKHKARYDLPGLLYSEEYSKELSSRSPEEAASVAPPNAFAFVLLDEPVPDFEYDPNRFRVVPIPENKSERYFLGGTVYTVAELRELPDDHAFLIGNVERGSGRAIRCRTGNWQEFKPNDVLLDVE